SALTPAFGAAGLNDSGQNNAPLSGAAKTGFEEMNERQVDLAQLNGRNDHKYGSPSAESHYDSSRGLLSAERRRQAQVARSDHRRPRHFLINSQAASDRAPAKAATWHQR